MITVPTYEQILERMLDRIGNEYDKRESSIIYSALAPAAVELEKMYIELEWYYQETFADTASREPLIKRAKERGVTPYEATYAYFLGEFKPPSVNVPIGARFNLDQYNFIVTEKVSPGMYKLQCESKGADVNTASGDLIPIEYIDGLISAKILRLLIPGEDVESTQSIRERYFKTFDVISYGGNIKDYKTKVNAIPGVGVTRVIPIWNGGGTVKLVILDSQFQKATDELVARVQEIVDPPPQGKGYGIAPIGHVVTVTTAQEKIINVSCKIIFSEGSFADHIEEVKSAIDEYFGELRRGWENAESVTVRIAKIEAAILQIDSVIDVQQTALNGLGGNLTLDGSEIPVLGSVVEPWV